eukprot:TRINITY_DN191_c0_g1_i4.p1 TRINITY_DN191_c0_g1~~TRINITY_DN191_c0_g1_i4.p1  ORF type:complete len:186 (+),score=33.48 TRINITY_DN191_c0_g1_i4:58-615(+)
MPRCAVPFWNPLRDRLQCPVGTHCEIDYWNGKKCVNDTVDPCKEWQCMPFQHCEVSPNKIEPICVSNKMNSCDGYQCDTDSHCVVDTWGKPSCEKNTGNPCSKINCPWGTVCEVDNFNGAKCVNVTTNPCDGYQCAKGEHCEINQWNKPECVGDANECQGVQCPSTVPCWNPLRDRLLERQEVCQ